MIRIVYLCILLIGMSSSTQGQDTSRLEIADLDSLQKEFFRQGHYKKGVPLAEALVRRIEARYGKRDTNYYNAIHSVLNFYREVGNNMQMYDLAKQMEYNIRQHLGEENKFYAEAIGDLASASFFMGKGKQILTLYRRLVELRGNVYGKKHPEYARALYNLGTTQATLGYYNESEALFKESLAILEREPTSSSHYGNIITPLNGLGQIYTVQKRYKEAEQLYKQALSIAAVKFSKNNRRYNMILKNLALLYTETGNYQEAEQHYIQALQQMEASGGINQMYVLTSRDLADFYIKTKQPDKAKKELDKVLIIEKTLGSEHPTRSLTYHHLTSLAIEQEQWEQALGYCLQGLSVNAELPFSSLDIHTLCAQHSLHKATYRNTSFALTTLRQLVKVLQRLSDDTNDRRWLNYLEHVCQFGLSLVEKLKIEVQYDEDKHQLLQTQADFAAAGTTAALALGKTAQAFLYAEQGKAASLAGALKMQKANFFGFLPDSLHQRSDYLSVAIDQTKKGIWELGNANNADKKRLQAQLNDLYQQQQQLQNHIKAQYPKYHQLKYLPFSTTLADIQEVLPEDILLVEYMFAGSSMHIFCLTKTEIKALTIPINKAELDEKVKQLRNSLSRYEDIRNNETAMYQQYTEAAYWFYNTFLTKPLAMMPAKKRLLIVPDGALGHLPFETFLTQPAQDVQQSYSDLPYLLKSYEVGYSYSATLLAENCRFKCTLNPKILGLAATYPTTSKSGALRDALQALPNAKAEVQRLEQLFTGAFLYDEYANEQNFKELAPKYGILHLAVHGILDRQHPLLSNLVLTETGDTTEDDFLQAHEISHLQLNALLVVLSACETGYGKFQAGEGIMSLGRAFMYAGAPALVVSLWEVNDASTAKIMELFYLNLSANMNKAEALRQAKLQYITANKGISAHPAFWSAFVHIGDSRPVQLKQQADYWVFYVLVVVVVVGGGWLFARRWAMATAH